MAEKTRLSLYITTILLVFSQIESLTTDDKPNASDDQKTEKSEKTSSEEIIKPKTDWREYRGIILENELRVLLINDSKADTALVAMAVGAGTVQDPEGVQGIANLMQFILKDGSEKYPEPTEYTDYLNKIGSFGGSQLWDYVTLYNIGVPVKELKNVLDRFADIFAAPLMSADQIDGEIYTVNEQYKAGANNDWGRLRLVKMDTLSENSEFRKFSGNEKTLKEIPEQEGIDVHEKLKEFYEQYYSANNMGLVVLGGESLDELQEMVTTAFSSIENRNVKRPVYKKGSLTKAELGKIIYTVPLMDLYSLEVDFDVPDDVLDYAKAPIQLIQYCLNQKTAGSLYSFLHNEGLVTSFDTNYVVYSRGATQLEVLIDLTEEGLQKFPLVIYHLFQYLYMLRAAGDDKKRLFEEIEAIAQIDFETSNYNVTEISARILDYPINEVLHERVPTTWDSDTIEDYLEYLNPENCRIFVSAKEFEDKADRSEPISGVKYHVEEVNQKYMEGWLSAKPENEGFALPEANVFIPETLELFPVEDDTIKSPIMIEDTDLIRAWFMQDTVYLKPKTFLTVYLRRPRFTTTPRETMLTRLFASIFYDVMTESTDAAAKAGLQWSISVEFSCMIISVNGYTDKLPALVEIIFDSIRDFTFSSTIFEINKDNIRRDIISWKTDYTASLAMYYLRFLLSSREFTPDQLLDSLTDITEEEMNAYMEQVFSAIFIETFVYGNCNMDYAKEMIDYVKRPFKDVVPSILSIYLPKRRIFMREGLSNFINLKSFVSNNSAICFYYQCGLSSYYRSAVLDLFNQLITSSFFNTLQNDERLSFVQCNIVTDLDRAQGLVFIIESSHDINTLVESLTKFVDSIEELLQALTEEDFTTYKKSLKYALTYVLPEMQQQNDDFLGEIFAMTYDFQRYPLQAEKVDAITKSQLLEFYRLYFKTDGKKRTILFIHILPENESPSDNNFYEEAILIDDIAKFKMRQYLAPVEGPNDGITPAGIPSEF